MQLPAGEARPHTPSQRDLPRFIVDVKQVLLIRQHELHCPVLILVTICCRHCGNDLVWQSPHGDPRIDGVLVADRHIVVHILHLYGHRRHGAQWSLSTAVGSHGSEGVLSPALSVQRPGGLDHSGQRVYREGSLAAVLRH